MKRALVFLCVISLLVLALGGVANATWVTYSFDPNDWVTNYSLNNSGFTETRLQQDNPRIYINGVLESTDTTAGVHTTYAGASYSSSGVAGYANQIPNVEIHDFNMWLADGINAPNWGEVLTQVQGSIPTGTATNRWAVSIIDNPWPQAGYGSKLVQWYDVGYWDDDPNTPAAPLTFGSGGIDFGVFTMTVDLNATDYYGNPVNFNVAQRIWLGTILPDGDRFEGTMEMAPVPEPATMILLGSGLVGLAGVGKKKFFKKG